MNLCSLGAKFKLVQPSDHRSSVLHMGTNPVRSFQFRFENCWLSNGHMETLITEAWEFNILDSESCRLTQRLIWIKCRVKKKIRETKSALSQRKVALKEA
eukprot:TRINITY_DN7331_c0_g3_i1.p1 TRINITY_DN7331_c0_g3~~TRINITY_DN7331_c0_g3_i1.p1  ORF type:complete len:100 (-),score=14.19 TRINITY_DN7331_c0_g3_i1:31-330(-)